MSPDFSLHRGAIPKKKKRVKTFVKNYGLELFLFSLSYIMGKLYGISMGLSSSKCTSKNTNYNAAFEKRVSDNAQMSKFVEVFCDICGKYLIQNIFRGSVMYCLTLTNAIMFIHM